MSHKLFLKTALLYDWLCDQDAPDLIIDTVQWIRYEVLYDNDTDNFM